MTRIILGDYNLLSIAKILGENLMTEETTKYCSKCGHAVKISENFCGNCGYRLKYGRSMSTSIDGFSKKKRFIILAIIILGVIILFVTIGSIGSFTTSTKLPKGAQDYLSSSYHPSSFTLVETQKAKWPENFVISINGRTPDEVWCVYGGTDYSLYNLIVYRVGNRWTDRVGLKWEYEQVGCTIYR